MKTGKATVKTTLITMHLSLKGAAAGLIMGAAVNLLLPVVKHGYFGQTIIFKSSSSRRAEDRESSSGV